MSRRPNIQTAHERKVDRKIQADRRAREAAAKKAAGPVSPVTPEPYITCFGRGRPAQPIPKPVQAWIDEETRDQLKRYRKIYREMEALAPQRERWVAEFFERISGPRGFSVHAGTRRTIPKAELPVRPDRPWRVIW